MAVYTVHTSPSFNGNLDELDQVVFVKEGISWIALLVPFLWFLWHGLWLSFLLYLLYSVLAAIFALFVSEIMVSIVTFCLSVLIALEANQLRRWKLERKGWRLSGIVAGRNRDECESKYFSSQIHGFRSSENSSAEAVLNSSNPSVAGDDQVPNNYVVGLFPRPVNER